MTKTHHFVSQWIFSGLACSPTVLLYARRMHALFLRSMMPGLMCTYCRYARKDEGRKPCCIWCDGVRMHACQSQSINAKPGNIIRKPRGNPCQVCIIAPTTLQQEGPPQLLPSGCMPAFLAPPVHTTGATLVEPARRKAGQPQSLLVHKIVDQLAGGCGHPTRTCS